MREVEAFIRQTATSLKIDPDTAVAVARTEGLAPGVWQSRLPAPGGGAGREASYGPYQLYMGGGLGNAFQQQTGMDPRDPATWQHQVIFALQQAKQGGWTPWHGAANNGISRWAGINPNAPGVSPTAPPLATSSVSTSPPVNPAALPPGFTAPAAPAVPASGTGPTTTGSVQQPRTFQDDVDEMALAGTQERYKPLMGTAVPTQEQTAAARALYRGDGMADPNAAKALDEFMGSDWDYDYLSPQTRRLVNEVATFNYLKRSDPEAAKKVAGELQQLHDNEAMRYASFARAAVQAGDEKGALDATMKSIAAIPNNVEATYEKQEDGDYMISFLRNGQEVHRELVEPDRLLGTIWNAGPKEIKSMLWKFQGLGGSQASQAGMQSVTMGQPDYSQTAGMTAEEEKAFYARADARSSKEGTETAAAVQEAANNLVGMEDPLNIGRGTPGPIIADFPAELQTEITKYRPYLEQIATRVADTNGLDAPAAVTAVFGQLMGIDPANPGDPPYEWEQLDEFTVGVDTETGPPIYISTDDFAYIQGRRRELENQFVIANETAQTQEELGAAESAELARRVGAGLPPVLRGSQTTEELARPEPYDVFAKRWLGAVNPMGSAREADYRDVIERAYQDYLSTFASPASGAAAASGR